MKNIFIVLLLMFTVSYANAQDLIKDARNGRINLVKDAEPNLIFQKYETIREERNLISESVSLFEINRSYKLDRVAEYVSDAVILDIRKEQVAQLLADQPESISFNLPIAPGKVVVLDLIRVTPLSPNFKAMTSSGRNFTTDDFDAVFYRGVIRNDPNSLVAISVFEDKVRGIVADDGGNYVLGKIKEFGLEDTYILYNDKNYLQTKEFSCGEEPLDHEEEEHSHGPATGRADFNEDCIGIYVECDFALYQSEGADVNSVMAYATALLNEVGVLYEAENVPISLAAVYIWDEDDEFSGETDTEGLLKEFRQFHNAPWFSKVFQDRAPDAELAHLITSRSVGGGRAYRDELCSNRPYAVSGSMGSFDPVPTYSWEVTVFAHEMGHNLGSRHTHDCKWNGNNTQIDDCGNVWLDSEGEDTPGCYDSSNLILPGNNGTIMSYCHLSWTIFNETGVNVSINFNSGFGPQPGDVLRDTYDDANCIDECGEMDCPIFLNLTSASPGTLTGSDLHAASVQTTASNIIASGASITYTGGERVELLPGFSALPGSNFSAIIDDCGTMIISKQLDPSEGTDSASADKDKTAQTEENFSYLLSVYPNPTSHGATFEFKLQETRRVQLELIDIAGKTVQFIFLGEQLEKGFYRKHVSGEKLKPGVYFVNLKIENDAPITRKLIVK